MKTGGDLLSGVVEVYNFEKLETISLRIKYQTEYSL